MRARHFLVGFIASIVSACAFAAGCGSSSNENGPVDSGSDVVGDQTLDVHKDGPGGDDVQDAGSDACDIDADLNNLPVPDASIGGDGGVSLPVCSACMKTNCQAEIAACNADCDCKDAFSQFFTCASTAKNASDIQNCLGILFGNANSSNLASCAFSHCQKECLGNFLGDGGGDAQGDAASDSASSDAQGQ